MLHVTLRTNQSWEDCNVHKRHVQAEYDVLKIVCHLWCCYRFSSSTEQGTSSRLMRRHRRRRRKPKAPRMERVRLQMNLMAISVEVCLFKCPHLSLSFSRSLQSSSFSSITDSTMSLNIITVTLNMGEYVHLSVCLPLNMHRSVKDNMNDIH